VAGGTYLSEDSSRVRLVVAKIFKYVGIAIGSVIVVLVSSALLYRKYLQHEVAEARAITSPSGIDSLEAVQIGGIEQWIEVRGQNVNNPILLFIHGGPGIAFMPMGSSCRGRQRRCTISAVPEAHEEVPAYGAYVAHALASRVTANLPTDC